MERKSIKFTFPNEEMCMAFFDIFIIDLDNDLIDQTLSLTKEYVEKEYGSKFWLGSNLIRYELVKTKKKRE